MEISQNQQIVYNTAIDQGASDTFAKLVLSQLIHESSNFTSHVFNVDNNPMGMKVPVKRKSPYIQRKGLPAPVSEGGNYAHYENIFDAVKDLFHYLRYVGIDYTKINTPDQYALVLKAHGYYGDSLSVYANALNKIYTTFKNVIMSSPLNIIVLLVIGVVFLLLFRS